MPPVAVIGFKPNAHACRSWSDAAKYFGPTLRWKSCKSADEHGWLFGATVQLVYCPKARLRRRASASPAKATLTSANDAGSGIACCTALMLSRTKSAFAAKLT